MARDGVPCRQPDDRGWLADDLPFPAPRLQAATARAAFRANVPADLPAGRVCAEGVVDPADGGRGAGGLTQLLLGPAPAAGLADSVASIAAQADPVSDPPRFQRPPGPGHRSGATPIPILPGARESDEELMRRVQGNDAGAIEQLYERHAKRALRVALAECHDPERAEDAVQEAFVGVWRGRLGYQPAAGSFVDWAMAIVRERAIEAARG